MVELLGVLRLMLLTVVGVRLYVNELKRSPVSPKPVGLLALIVTFPAEWDGVVHVMVVSFTTTKLLTLDPPNVTLFTPVKKLPVKVALVPPPVEPDVGEQELTTGPIWSVPGPVMLSVHDPVALLLVDVSTTSNLPGTLRLWVTATGLPVFPNVQMFVIGDAG